MLLIEWNIAAIAEKLNQLKAESKALWGNMTSAKMLQHLTQIQQISNGKIKIDFSNTPDNLPKLRHILYKEVPFPQEFKAPNQVEELLNADTEIDFESQRVLLLAEIDFFEKHFAEDGTTETNAVFGPLNREDWIWFHRKHISHHLAQFGLWSYT